MKNKVTFPILHSLTIHNMLIASLRSFCVLLEEQFRVTAKLKLCNYKAEELYYYLEYPFRVLGAFAYHCGNYRRKGGCKSLFTLLKKF